MLYHLVYVGWDLLHFHGIGSVFWIALGLWGAYRAYRWHHRKRVYPKRGSRRQP